MFIKKRGKKHKNQAKATPLHYEFRFRVAFPLLINSRCLLIGFMRFPNEFLPPTA